MSKMVKLLVGLAAVWLAAWLDHGPMGHGERTVSDLQTRAEAVIAETGIPDISVRFGRAPLSRQATLSGPADAFQRQGMGGQKGLTQLVGEIEGVKGVRWADESQDSFVLPLIAESLIAATLAYLAGLAIGWFVWGRPRREGFA